MLVLGHVATATVACRATNRETDLRWVVFYTLLADIIDKPLGLIVFRESINNGRVWFHSLAVNLALSVAILAWQRSTVLVLALWLHQLCDRMWTRPWVALWPLTGAFGYRDLPLSDWVYSVFSPYNVVSELIGLVVLGAIAWRYELFRAERFRSFLRTGRLLVRSAPSGLTSSKAI
jgi:inner membrane protein